MQIYYNGKTYVRYTEIKVGNMYFLTSLLYWASQ